MKALIFQNKVIDISETPFEVHESMFWVDCPDDCVPETWEYDYGSFVDTNTKLTYSQLRAVEYPPMTDYLDAIVKGDTAQQQAYIDACLAVKAKYPKGVA